MKPAIKAVLISGLVFPGLGHLVLKQGARGCLFLLPAAVAVAYLLREVLRVAALLLAELDSGVLAVDPARIAERIHTAGLDNPATNLASLIVLVCWAGAIADTLWLTRRPAP